MGKVTCRNPGPNDPIFRRSVQFSSPIPPTREQEHHSEVVNPGPDSETPQGDMEKDTDQPDLH